MTKWFILSTRVEGHIESGVVLYNHRDHPCWGSIDGTSLLAEPLYILLYDLLTAGFFDRSVHSKVYPPEAVRFCALSLTSMDALQAFVL